MDERDYSLQLLSGNLTPERPPPGFESGARSSMPDNESTLVLEQPPSPPDPEQPQPEQSEIAVFERRVKVDPDVAYRSGLCKRCEPSRSSPWESGALMWLQIGFALL